MLHLHPRRDFEHHDEGKGNKGQGPGPTWLRLVWSGPVWSLQEQPHCKLGPGACFQLLASSLLMAHSPGKVGQQNGFSEGPEVLLQCACSEEVPQKRELQRGRQVFKELSF